MKIALSNDQLVSAIIMYCKRKRLVDFEKEYELQITLSDLTDYSGCTIELNCKPNEDK